MTADRMPKSLEYAALFPGDHIPWPTVRASNNPEFKISALGGLYTVLCFFITASDPAASAALAAVAARQSLFDDAKLTFFGVSLDPVDESSGRCRQSLPGMRYFWDFDGGMARAFGVLPVDPAGKTARRVWLVLDPALRVVAAFPLLPDNGNIGDIFAYLERLPPVGLAAGVEVMAPVLYLPRVFEPDFCRELIAMYEADGGQRSGFMREIDGRTEVVNDSSHKVRRDYVVEDADVIRAIQARVRRRIVPEVRKIHCFDPTHMERYLVGCYTAEEGGHFQPHRDNTTKGTAHRRFAVSINLNADFEGGELCFPEYGPRRFKPPPGGAVVFSCSLMHMVTPVTSGRRYAFLPFLYDEAASRLRLENNPFLADESLRYRG